MTTLPTRILRTDPARARFCADCQVGQGRNCACHAAKPKRRPLTVTEATWLVLVADVAVLLAVVALARWAL